MTNKSVGTDPLRAWFAAQGWRPLEFQEEAWSAYLAGADGLIHAATGTGKTYAAWGGPLLEALAATPATSEAPPLRVLWITPLRALASDTLQALATLTAGVGLSWTIQVRTGDTSSSQRSAQKKRLPTALITTPESLCLLLSHADAPERFAHLRGIIVDEWHELLAGKRGVLLELALARLRTWRPFVRTWGLSATLGNIDTALRVLVGNRTPSVEPRLIRGLVPKSIVIDSIFPKTLERFPWAGHLGVGLVPQVVQAIEEGATALVFTNTRAQTEIWYQELLKARPDWAGVMALHHGSLDRQVRDFVEDGLRNGRLRCVVCTSSLDLGVDFTPVDRVVQIGSPKGVARLLQRAGRSGHQPGRPSRVSVVPTNALELIEVAAARAAAEAGEIEGRTPYDHPLDVLVQHLVTVAVGTGFRAEDLYREVITTHAFARLSRAEFDWALDFVVHGGESLRAYADYHRVEVDAEGVFRVLRPTIARRHRLSIGTIVGEAVMQIRYVRGKVLGTVEESFIARLKPGDVFQFGGKLLELVRIHELTAWVRQATKSKGTVPRWMGSRMPLSSELASAVRAKLEEARRGEFTTPEMRFVRPLLELQQRWSILPAGDELLIEQVRTREGVHLFFFPFEGRSVHEGLAALTAYRLSRRKPLTFTIAVNDYGFELLGTEEPPLREALADGLLTPAKLSEDIAAGLNAVEPARRAFREIARIAGLVHPGFPGAGKTTKQLQASSSLFYEVFRNHDPGNLLLHQAQREVLEKQFEETRLRMVLMRLSTGRVTITTPKRPTPLAFPLLVDRMRESLSSEKLSDRVRRMQLDLEREADGSTESAVAPRRKHGAALTQRRDSGSPQVNP